MENIQLIVECGDAFDEDMLAEIGVVKYKLPIIGACVVEVSPEQAKYLRELGSIKAVYETSNIIAQYKSPEYLTGRGINIAVLDTGLCTLEDFTKPYNRIVAFMDFVNGRTDCYDDNGHGTHVAY